MTRTAIEALTIATAIGCTSPPTTRPATGTRAPATASAAAAAAPSTNAASSAPAPPRAAAAASSASAAVPTPPPDMLFVPGGTFTMGADTGGEEDEHPAHAVSLASFFLDRTEVTNAAYGTCVSAKRCRDRARVAQFTAPQQPVTFVSWDDANAFCASRGRRLPSEAEFERAVRGDDGRRYPWGEEPPTDARTVFLVHHHPLDVGSRPAGRGPYGHDDLAGNVWEWTGDHYDPYAYRRPTAATGKPGTCDEIRAAQEELRRAHKQGFTGTNPLPTECEHAIRGGAYNYAAGGLRSTNRVHHEDHFRIAVLGFRCAMDAPPVAGD